MIGHIGYGVAGRWPTRSFWYLALLDLRSPHRCPGRDVDEWPGFIEKRLDLAPLAHEHFELVERVKGLFAAEDDHAGAAAADRVDLGAVFLDMAVPGDDEPMPPGGLGDPPGIRCVRPRDRARRPVPSALHRAARVAGVRHVSADPNQFLRQAEHVGVYVEAHGCRPGRLAP